MTTYGESPARTGSNGLAVAGLVCGIVGIFLLNYILGPLAIIFGGIGLSNVDARLRATFGERYALRIDSELGHGTTAVMTVPNLAGDQPPAVAMGDARTIPTR